MPNPSSGGMTPPPTFKKLTAARAPGGAAVLWGLHENGEVWVSYEMSDANAWSPWESALWAGEGGPQKVEM